MVIGVLHGMKVKCQLLRRNFFFPFLPTGVLYGMKVKCNLMRQIYKRHLALQIFFARNHTLFSSTKQVRFHSYMILQANKITSAQQTLSLSSAQGSLSNRPRNCKHVL